MDRVGEKRSEKRSAGPGGGGRHATAATATPTMQDRLGNQGVLALLKRMTASPPSPPSPPPPPSPPGGPPVLQRSSLVSTPGDPAEQEAERVAAAESCACGAKPSPLPCPTCARVQRATEGASPSPPRSLPSSVQRAVGEGGAALDDHTRGHFEGRFGADLSGVRVHTGSVAAGSARDLEARAYTVKNHIVFGEGRYQPHASEGRRLLAHELTHVVQQRAGGALIHREPEPNPAPAPASQQSPPPAGATNTCGSKPGETEGGTCSVPTPPAGATTIPFEGFQLSPDEEYLYQILKAYYPANGAVGTFGFVQRFFGHHPAGAAGETAGKIQPLLLAAFTRLRRDIDAFLETFKNDALTALNEILDQSHERVQVERARYGLPDPEPEMEHYQESAPVRPDAEMPDNSGTRGLAAAATLYKNLRQQHKDKAADLNRQLEAAVREEYFYGQAINANFEEYQRLQDRRKQLSAERDVENRSYEFKTTDLQRRFPILASYADATDYELDEIGKGPSKELGLKLQYKIYEILRNIKTVRIEAGSGVIDVWTLPRLISSTRLRSKVEVGSFADRAIKDKEKQVADDEFWKSIGLGVLQLGLVIFGGPYGAVGAAAISGYQMVSDFQKYGTQAALAATDFDKAKAISGDDPSMLWLAADVVFFIMDMGAAAKAFAQLRPLVRAAHAAQEGEAAARAGKALEQEATKLGGEGLAKRVAAEAKVGEEVSSVERLYGKEGKALAEVGELAEKEAKGVLSAGEAAGSTVKVTEGGHVVVCSSPCEWMRERFKDLLPSSGLEGRLTAIEEKAARAAKEADKSVAKKLADEARNEAQALQRELKYMEYTKGGGTGTIEEFDKLVQTPPGSGPYRDVGGHHVHGKAAFRGHVNYDLKDGFSISQDFMKQHGWEHELMTAKQRQLSDALRASGRANTMAEQSYIAVESLIAGGATRKEAEALVNMSLREMGEQGVTAPTRIMWDK